MLAQRRCARRHAGARAADRRADAANHLPGGAISPQLSTGGFAETVFDGVGFGLGFAVMLDPMQAAQPVERRRVLLGRRLLSTAFWVDPVDDMTCVFMTQLMPSGSLPIRPQLRQLVYAALRVDTRACRHRCC